MPLGNLFRKSGKNGPPPATSAGDDTTLAPSDAPSLADEKMQPTATSTLPESRSHSTEDEKPAALKEQAAETTGEDEDEEDETEYPKSTQLILITVALCLSVFCMALDQTIVATAIPKVNSPFFFPAVHFSFLTSITDHRSVSSHQRCWLVWLCLSSHHLRLPALFRQALYLLQRQMDLLDRSGDF